MADITAQEIGVVGGKILLWEALTENDTAVPADLSGFAPASVEVIGTFGAGTIILRGTNMPKAVSDAPTYFALTSDGSTAVSFTADGGSAVYEWAHRIQPHASVAGTGRDVDIYLFVTNPTRR